MRKCRQYMFCVVCISVVSVKKREREREGGGGGSFAYDPIFRKGQRHKQGRGQHPGNTSGTTESMTKLEVSCTLVIPLDSYTLSFREK